MGPDGVVILISLTGFPCKNPAFVQWPQCPLFT